jgi:hypothetical protein
MLPNWNIICELLQELPSLHVLHFEILACDHDADYRFEHYEIYTLCSILKPLRQIKARMIEVEMNVKVPDRVWEILGPVHFTTTFGDRPFNESVFKMKHVHDAIKVPHPCE